MISLIDQTDLQATEYKIFHYIYDPFIFIAIHHTSHQVEYIDGLFKMTSLSYPSDSFDSVLRDYLMQQEELKNTKPCKPLKKKSKKPLKPQADEDEGLNFSQPSSQTATTAILKIEKQPMKKQLIEPDKISYISGWINKFSGHQRITDDDLNALLIDLENLFVRKNIAQNIASELIKEIHIKLRNKQVGRFESIWSIIKQTTNAYLTRILIPKQSTDLLSMISAKQEPYIMAFIGVNGVGKTTNLSKICYWLLMHHKSILIAACDTFRSGAVEQLQVHVDRLSATFDTNIELYQQGYKKDAASVAKDAIKYATNKFDVVLIDTAGRMQDDEPLMRSLAKLVQMNPIDKIVFVGEALVGNECIEQLTKFNNVIKQRANRQVDYILLTKFDTVDDLVGAAINMVYLTKQPILFVGIGQHYQDLCELDVASVVASILKS